MNSEPGFTYSIRTLGCKANTYDSLVLERELIELGGRRDNAAPDLFVLNSCTVTSGADKQCLAEVKRVKRRSPRTWAVVTGCYAQVAEEEIRRSFGVDAVINNANKRALRVAVAERFRVDLPAAKDAAAFGSAGADSPGDDVYWGQLPAFAGKTRAFLKIQEGCDDGCTYCIIPRARGKSRSVRLGLVLAEVQRLADSGVKEVVLAGVNLADYGKEHSTQLEDVLEAILEHTTIPRLRLTSLDPSAVSDRILALMSPAGRLMPHVHVSLQSVVSRVLRAMRRRTRREDAVSALERIHARSADIFVGMDVIAGFPSEAMEEHREGLALLKQLPWSRLHVFPYSEREGTPATRIPGVVSRAERQERARELLDLSRSRHEAFVRRYVGRMARDVLFESAQEADGDPFIVGHTPNYVRVMVRVPSRSAAEAGSWSNRVGAVRVSGAVPWPEQDWTLEGELATVQREDGVEARGS